jgi:hypothetical protein
MWYFSWRTVSLLSEDIIVCEDLVKIYNELGFKYAETNAMLENNLKIHSTFEPFEREVHKRRWIFGKEI